MKPVGQRTVIEDGVPADEDAVLMRQVFDLPESLTQMSPVHIPRGFTQATSTADRSMTCRPASGRPMPHSRRTTTSC